MKALGIVLVLIGVLIFASLFISGIWFAGLGMFSYISWFLGIILIIVGLWFYSKK